MNYHIGDAVGVLCLVVYSLNISLSMGLSITLKAEVKLPGWLQKAVAQCSEQLHPSMQLKQEALGSNSSGCLEFFVVVVVVVVFFLFQLAY